MKAIIIGAGEVGFNTAKLLTEENHDVILIDPRESARRRCEAQLDLLALPGNGASPRVLAGAGIQDADLFIGVTDHDETNILACSIAKHRHVPTCIARVSNPDYFGGPHSISSSEFGVDLVINPLQICAEELHRLIIATGARELIEFADGRVRLVGFRVQESMPLQGKPLIEVGESGLLSAVRCAAIGREGETLVPRGSDRILPGDELYVIGASDAISTFLTQLGEPVHRRLARVVIAGAGQIAQHLTQILLDNGIQVRIIESDATRAEAIKIRFERVHVLHGESTDETLLLDAGSKHASAFVALTEDDEDNLISCVFASRRFEGIRTFTLIQKPRYVPIVAQMRSIDGAVSPQLAAVSHILRYVRQGQVLSAASLREIDAEALEFVVEPGAPIVGHPLCELDFPSNAVIGAVVRSKQVIVPTGGTIIQAGDRAIVFSLPESIPAVEKLFARK